MTSRTDNEGPDPAEVIEDVTAKDSDTSGTDAATWKLRAHHKSRTLTAYHPRRTVSKVEWTSEVFARYSQLELPIGVTSSRTVVVNLKGETPHFNTAGRTGWGKTVLFGVLIGGFLYHGGHTDIVDPKGIDFPRPFARLRNVQVHTVSERFPQILSDYVLEMERRSAIIGEFAERAEELGLPDMADNAELYFQPLQLAIDEKSRFTAKCNAWWKTAGGGLDDNGNPKPGKGPSIAIEWERDLVARGRALCIYLLAAAQANAMPATFADTDIRGNYQYKVLIGPADGPSWVTTFPGERKRRISRQVKGRAIVGVGADLDEAQMAFMPRNEIRAAAERGESVMDALNQRRAELLAQATGRPVWEVSPLPWWVPAPARTGENVHGQDTPVDTPAEGRAERGALSLVKLTPRDDVADGDHDSNVGSSDEENSESNASSSSGDQFEGPSRDAETISGNAAAADHLDTNLQTFMRARSRAKKRGEGEIPGMTRGIGGGVVYDARQLEEWWSQRPGSGRQAS